MFKAVRVDKGESGSVAAYGDFDEKDLMDGDVTIRVSHSAVNYKDGLAITGKSPVVRRFPMVPGVDFVGRVEETSNPNYRVGDAVILTGWGVGETHLGGFAQKARVKGDWLIPLPDGLSPRQAASLGTAGLTAMLSVIALERHGCKPSDGAAIVTGASGGVGSLAVMLLARAGWRVIASTGRTAEADYLRALGAEEIIDRNELTAPGRPMGKERWAVGVDVVGSHTLANVLAQTRYRGAVAACGLTQGMDLPTTVAPFILRGVSLLGIDSVMCPKAQRAEAWSRLARDCDLKKLEAMTQSAPLEKAIDVARSILGGEIRGRMVIDVP